MARWSAWRGLDDVYPHARIMRSQSGFPASRLVFCRLLVAVFSRRHPCAAHITYGSSWLCFRRGTHARLLVAVFSRRHPCEATE